MTVRELLTKICPHIYIDYTVIIDGEYINVGNVFDYENYVVDKWRINQDIDDGLYLEIFTVENRD